MATKWPDEVPVLSSRHMTRGYVAGDRRCLIAWTGDVFDCTTFGRVDVALESACRDSGVALHAATGCGREVSLALMARIWNRAMAKLGYVVNNPEAKYLKKNRSER